MWPLIFSYLQLQSKERGSSHHTRWVSFTGTKSLQRWLTNPFVLTKGKQEDPCFFFLPRQQEVSHIYQFNAKTKNLSEQRTRLLSNGLNGTSYKTDDLISFSFVLLLFFGWYWTYIQKSSFLDGHCLRICNSTLVETTLFVFVLNVTPLVSLTN